MLWKGMGKNMGFGKISSKQQEILDYIKEEILKYSSILPPPRHFLSRVF